MCAIENRRDGKYVFPPPSPKLRRQHPGFSALVSPAEKTRAE